ncbi:phosphopantothenoylcysteine decarboxylase, partial [Cobetia sp.]|uniref:phosphopantothenoylcysteine decarboxylase n=1 Tax=Cobetia sp. TaxID=1873876 RepID=UPI000E957EB9
DAPDLDAAAEAAASESDLFIGCAAVADFRPATVADHKLKKQSGEEQMQVTLTRNPDIIAGIAAQTQARRAAGQRAPLVIGFAAETRDVLRYARDKLARKQLDMIVANDVSTPGLGFGSDSNAATLLWQPLDQNTNTQHEQAIAACPKTELARAILKRALALHQHRVSLDPAIQTVTPTVTDDQEAP